MDERLTEVMTGALLDLEERGDIVIVTTAVAPLAEHMAAQALTIMPRTDLASSDLAALRSLLVHLAHGPAYHAADLPAVTGYSLDRFGEMIPKLPAE